MSDTWNGAWGASWGASWGYTAPFQMPQIGSFYPTRKRKKSHREDIEDDIRAILKEAKKEPDVLHAAIRTIRKVPTPQLLHPVEEQLEVYLRGVVQEVRALVLSTVRAASKRAAKRRKQQQNLLLF